MNFVSAIESNLHQFYEFVATQGELELVRERCFQNKSRLIILHSSVMGENIYRKIGFKEYYKIKTG
jgi:hypothetical protein